MKSEHIRLDRLNAGAPVLDAHSVWSRPRRVEADCARIEKGKGAATLRFGKRAEVEPIYQDIKDRITAA